MPKVLNMRDLDKIPDNAVMIDRTSKFGNPFFISLGCTRPESIAKHKAWLLRQEILLRAIKKELEGKDLVCWCTPKPCHGDTLLEIANNGKSVEEEMSDG